VNPQQNLTKAEVQRSLLLTSVPLGDGDAWGTNCPTPALSPRSVGIWNSPPALKGQTRW
jgi:hypothetical protein